MNTAQVPLRYDSAGITTTGTIVHTPSLGERLIGSLCRVHVLTPWNGSGSPTLTLYVGDTPATAAWSTGFPLADVEGVELPGGELRLLPATSAITDDIVWQAWPRPLKVLVTDGTADNANPGSTQGIAVLSLVYEPPGAVI